MNNEQLTAEQLERKFLVAALENYVLAHRKLSSLWSDSNFELTTDYPFDTCFNELTTKVQLWVNTSRETINQQF